MLRDVRFLNMGWCLIDQSQLVMGDSVGEMVRIPIWAYLLRGDDALLLVDSGMPEGCIGNERYFGEMEPADLILPQMRREDLVDEVLRRQGLRIGDIDALIGTHAHFDHLGGMRLFGDTPICVHPAEIAAMRSEPEPPAWIDPDRPYRPLEDGVEPMPGVRVVHTPGHTPGHLSLLLEPQGGRPIVLAADAVYTGRNWELDIPGAMADPAEGTRSVGRLRAVVRAAEAAVFFGHDPHQANEPFWQSFVR